MTLNEIALKMFILLRTDSTSDDCLQLIRRLKPTHLILVSDGADKVYYLVTAAETLAQLKQAPAASPLSTAISLDQLMPVPALDVATSADDAPDQCIVTAGSRVVGFFDSSLQPKHMATRLGVNGYITAPESLTPQSLMAECPDQVELGETTSLIVSVTTKKVAGGLILADSLAGATIDVVIQAKQGFAIAGEREGSIEVLASDESLPIQFKLKAVDLGLGWVRILAFYKGQALGVITLRPVVVATKGQAPDVHTYEARLAPATAQQPDLSLLVFESGQGDETQLELRLVSSKLGFNYKRFGPIRIRKRPFGYFQGFFEEIEQLPFATDAEKRYARQRLAAKGAHLFETILPADLRKEIWELRDQIGSMQIQSEEPWIPWELCKLSGKQDGHIVDGPFFCEAFAMTRWLPEIPLKPELSLNQMALIAPSDSGLIYAQQEVDYILSLAGKDRQVTHIAANYQSIYEALASGVHDGWHFTGHSNFSASDPDRSAIMLEQGFRLLAEDISGMATNLGRAKPLVFLNSCQIGRGGMALTGIGGWAKRFLEAGAGAFIGAYWAIDDEYAVQFAESIYNCLLAGAALGQAVRDSRRTISENSDPTWLAYTVFADPLAKLKSA